MSHVAFDDPCVLFALQRERVPFCREFRPNLKFKGSPCWACFCGPSWLPVLVVETGVGQASVTRVLDWLLAKPKCDGVPCEPGLMLFAGFAGALSDARRLGDVVVVDEVVDEHGHAWKTTWPPLPLEGAWQPPLHVGRLLTTDRLIASPDEKRRLGETHGAVAVDMESALFAERCARAGVPFGCVRVISDDVATPISQRVMTLLEGGTVTPWRIIAELARRPGMVPELLRLGRDTKRASRQLGLALGELLTLTLSWMNDDSKS
jgi:adenosylhomocysteine nucleosidase